MSDETGKQANDCLQRQVTYLFDTGFFSSVQIIAVRQHEEDPSCDVAAVGAGPMRQQLQAMRVVQPMLVNRIADAQAEEGKHLG